MSHVSFTRRIACAIFLLSGVFWAVAGADAADKVFPFYPGEKMTFRFRWNFITAGTGTMEVFPITDIDGTKAYHFVLTARSSSFIDLFYEVRTMSESYSDTEMTRSLLYREKSEGSEKKDVLVTFDWNRKEVQYSNFGKARDPVSILPGSFDPLSLYYAFRLYNLDVGDVIEIPVTDGKKSVIGKAKVAGRETIEVMGKAYDTYRIEPDLEHFGGVFKKSKKAKLEIWLSADEKKIPLRMRVKVIIGSIVFERVENM
jgi:hypothetical protein